MSEKKPAFTTGPWVVEENDDGHTVHMGTYLVKGGRKSPLHEIVYNHGIYVDDDYPQAQDEFAEAEANARLVAAAPDMFEALEAAIEFMESVDPNSFTLADARAALSKATGVKP